MEENMFTKFAQAAGHHQIIITIIAAVSLICLSWSIEKILEEYIIGKRGCLKAYFITILIAIGLLWFIKHYILHVI